MSIAIFVGALTLVALVSTVLSKRKRASKPKPTWTVRVVKAVQERLYHSDYDQGGIPVEDTMAVRLVRGKEELTIATVKVTNAAFDEQMTAAIQKAEERATSLNAVCEETN